MKRLYVFSIILFFSGLCYAQSQHNNELFAKGVELYQAGKYKEAIPYFEQVVALDSIELGVGTPRNSHSSVWLSSCWYKLGNTKKAKEIDNQGYETCPIDRRLTVTVDSLFLLGLQTQDVEQGFKIFLRCIQMENEIVPYPNIYRINLMAFASIALNNQNKTEEALLYANMAESTCRQTISSDNPLYLDVWKTKASILFNSGRFDEALDELEKAAGLMIDIKQTETQGFCEILDQALRIAFLQGDEEAFNEGAPYVADLTKKLYGELSEKYANELGDITLMSGELQDTICLEIGPEYARVTEAVFGYESPQYQQACSLMFQYGAKFMNNDIARKYLPQWFDVSAKLNPEQPNPAYLKNLLISGTYMYEDLDSAEYHLNLALQDIETSGDSTDNIGRILVRYFQGTFYFMKGNYKEATPLLLEVFESSEIKASIDSITLDFNNIALAYSLCMSGDYARGRRIGRQTIDQLRSHFMNPGNGGRARGLLKGLSNYIKLFNTAHKNYLFSMPDSVKYAYAELYSELLRLKLEQLYKLEFENNEQNFYWTLRLYAHTSTWTQDFLHTRSIVQHYTDIVLAKYGEQSWQYDMCLSALYLCYDNNDNECINILKKQIAIEQDLYGKNDPIVISTMEQYYTAIGDQEALMKLKIRQHKSKGTSDAGTLARLYQAHKDYKSAIKLYQDDFNYKIKNNPNAFSLACTISDILKCMILNGQSDQVVNECLIMLRQVEKRRPAMLRDVMTSLLATFHGLTDNDKLRLKCIESLSTAFPNILGKDSELKACLLIAPYYYKYIAKNELEQVLSTFDRAIALAEPCNKRLADELRLGKLKTEYHAKNSNVDYRYKNSKEGADIYRIGQEIQDILQGYPEGNSTSEGYLATAIQLQGAWLQNDRSEINRLGKLITPLIGAELNTLIKNSEIVRIINNDMFFIYDPIKIEDYDDMLMEVMLQEDFGATDSQARINLLTKRVNQVKEHIASPFYSHSIQSEMEDLIQQATQMAWRWSTDSLAAMAYDASIYCKGAMMRSRQLMKKQIEHTGNETARRLLEDLRTTNQLIDRSAEYSNKHFTDSLTARKKALEDEMVKKASMFGDYAKELTASWRDVQSRLQHGEAAIEFSQYITDKTYYCALVLNPAYDYPHLVSLCTDEELMSSKDAYSDTRLYDLIWKPLLPDLDGVKSIYFSPSGLIYQIAIEDALADDGQRMSHKYDLYRLSNTRELIARKQSTGTNKALLMGGIQYELDPEEWEHIAINWGESFDNTFASRDIVSFDEIKTRGAINFLSGTDIEVDNIAEQMAKVNVPTTCAKGSDASEDLFKISCIDNTIIHIATHGFYLSNNADMPRQPAIGSEEDLAMSRSGLLMAGSMSYLNKDQIPDNVDDGILTAKEISRLDLTTASLVTLSACETALGDITGEGVFGLQRGFKKAGANSILMSLWKVDDEATCMLMTEFYRYWIGQGNTKHKALELAKEAVRNHPGWEDPKYWAAFILLDGLD